MRAWIKILCLGQMPHNKEEGFRVKTRVWDKNWELSARIEAKMKVA